MCERHVSAVSVRDAIAYLTPETAIDQLGPKMQFVDKCAEKCALKCQSNASQAHELPHDRFLNDRLCSIVE